MRSGAGTSDANRGRHATSGRTGQSLCFFARLGATRGGSSGCFGYTGGHGASCSPAARSRSCSARSGSSDWGSASAHGSPTARSLSAKRRDREVIGVHVVELVPTNRRRHLGARSRPHRPRAEHGLVRRVLVVVDEDAFPALLLPPRGGQEVGTALLELARHRNRGRPHLVRVPARLQPDVHVQPAVAGGLRISDDAQFVEQRAQLVPGLTDLREVGAGLRIEVESQLVGVLGVGREVRPHVEADATEVHRPHHVREVGRDHRVRRGAVRCAHDRRLEPFGGVLRYPLLEERRAFGTVREALHEHRPPAHGPHERLTDAHVVLDEIELGLTAFREEDLVGAGDPHRCPVEVEHLLRARCLRHRGSC